MALFEESTQASDWLFTSDSLSARREAARDAAAERCRTAGIDEEPLSADEEATIRYYHERRILFFARRESLPEKAGATAVTFFKRFFVDRSVTDYNPSVVAGLALYDACKVEEFNMSAAQVCTRMDLILNGASGDVSLTERPDSADGCAARFSKDALIDGETDFLDALAFQLICFHPYRSLWLLLERLENSPVLRAAAVEANPRLKGDELDEAAHKVHARIDQRARTIVRKLVLLCDAPLRYPPGLLALSCAVMAARDEKLLDGGNGVLRAAGAGGAGAADEDAEADAMVSGVRAKIDEVIAELESVTRMRDDEQTVLPLEKRRRRLANVANDPLSSESVAAAAARHAEGDEMWAERDADAAQRVRKRDRDALGWDGSDDDDDDDDDMEAVEVVEIDDDGDGVIEIVDDEDMPSAKRTRVQA